VQCTSPAPRLRVISAGGYKDTDAPHALALLSASRQRPRRCAAEQGDELAPFHCPMSPVLSTERDSTTRYGRRLPRCEISSRSMSQMGSDSEFSARSAVGTVITDGPPLRSVRAHGSHLGCVTAKLAVCAPAPVSRAPGSVSGACFAGSHSPWPLPLAPPAPLRSGPLCSSASQLLWQSLTSRDRASSATAPRLPDADRRRLPNGRSRDLPVPAQGASAHARVFDHAGSSWRSRSCARMCCLPPYARCRHPG
jgi:hypothetical protein